MNFLQQKLKSTNHSADATAAAALTAQSSEIESTLDKIVNFRVEFGPSTKDILNFTTQLSVMVKAGISIQEALESIASQIVNTKFKAVVSDLKNRIEAGESFSQALSSHRNVFSDLYINMISAAELSGSLSTMLEKLAGYLDQQAETRSQVRGAMVYPAIIAFMAVSCTIFLLTFVLPTATPPAGPAPPSSGPPPAFTISYKQRPAGSGGTKQNLSSRL